MDIAQQLAELPELKDAKDGHKCRVEVILEKTKDGIGMVSAKYIGDAGKKSKDEYMAMDDKAKAAYDQAQLDAQENETPAEAKLADEGEE